MFESSVVSFALLTRSRVVDLVCEKKCIVRSPYWPPNLFLRAHDGDEKTFSVVDGGSELGRYLTSIYTGAFLGLDPNEKHVYQVWSSEDDYSWPRIDELEDKRRRNLFESLEILGFGLCGDLTEHEYERLAAKFILACDVEGSYPLQVSLRKNTESTSIIGDLPRGELDVDSDNDIYFRVRTRVGVDMRGFDSEPEKPAT